MTLIPNDYQKGINEAFEISRKEIDALKVENKELNEQLRLHSVSQQRELFDSILDFIEDLPMCSEYYNRHKLYKIYIAENRS